MRPYVGNIILRRTYRKWPWERKKILPNSVFVKKILPNSVPGANDGVSKILRVPIFLPAGLMIKTDSIQRKDVGKVGVGPVGKNIADNIMIP